MDKLARRMVVGLGLLTAAASGCVTPASAQESGGRQLLLDERYARVAEQVPGFGGMYLGNDQRTLWVYVTRRQPDTMAKLRNALRENFPGADLPARIRLRRGDFSFDQLKRWKDSARDLLAMPGVRLTDIDEGTNRLVIGVEGQGPRSRVVQGLGAREIPPAAWRIEEVKPVRPNASLRSPIRPVVGGLEIQQGTSGPAKDGLLCTYGFTASRGDGVLGFVTASHCTLEQGGTEGTVFFQNSAAFAGERIGVETVDPPYRAGLPGCPSSRRCRYSDSAFAVLSDGVGALASIARPGSTGTPTWDGVSKSVITQEGFPPFLGATVQKVGRTTGLTAGRVTKACVDLNVNDVDNNPTDITFLCQTETTGFAQEGDSGAPVYELLPATTCRVGGAPCAKLLGIEFAGGGSNPITDRSYFSPIANIQRADELGPLQNCLSTAC